VQSVIYEFLSEREAPVEFGRGRHCSWRVAGQHVLTVMTGLPLNITGGSALNAPGHPGANLTALSQYFMELACPARTPRMVDVTPSNIVNNVPQCRGPFCQTAAGVLANEPRRAFSGPGSQSGRLGIPRFRSKSALVWSFARAFR